MGVFQSSPVYQGALLIVLSEFFLVCSGMVIKQLSGEVPTEVIVFARNAFGLILLLPWIARAGLGAVKTEKIHLHFLRAGVGVTAMTCLFYSWGHLPLAQAALLKQTGPFFMPILAFWWLGERISAMVKWAILVGFVGVMLILNPTEGTLNVAVLIALFGAMLGGFAKIVVRKMTTTEPAKRIVFYFALFAAIISSVPAALAWVTPTPVQIAWLFLMAGTSTLAQLLLSKGYSYAPAGQLGPFTYSSVALAALFGWLLWSEAMSLMTWAGIVVVTLAGLMSMKGKATVGSSSQ
ncbi:DMT family transporter [Pontibacterium granulatum]|uniref:DMT family transporter n=1 Tax=Pontibacterium granulatum TaxID=2036029 RepID=UPI00249BFC61|nr:DMT family transporter [Pontibacterium granulatum]MDI3324941.1 DMT family transporter [Pontibacterium granulatum]